MTARGWATTTMLAAGFVAACSGGAGPKPGSRASDVVERLRGFHPDVAALVARAEESPARRSAEVGTAFEVSAFASDPPDNRARHPHVAAALDAAWRRDSSGLVALLPESSTDTLRIEARPSGRRIRVRRTGGGRSEARRAGGAVVYADEAASVDTVIFARGAAVEELLIVRAPGEPLTYELEVPPGSRLAQADPRVVDVRDSLGSSWMRLRADAAWDSAGNVLIPELLLDGETIEVRVPGVERWPVVVDPAWELSDRMVDGRRHHAGILLGTGGVLVAGGCFSNDCDEGAWSSAEIYNVARGTFSTTGSMSVARHSFSAVRLPSGKVLVAGGCPDRCDTPHSSAELFDPAANGGVGAFEPAAPLGTARYGATATLLPTKKVLIAGGQRNPFSALDSTELYDPPSDTFSPGGMLTSHRSLHTATLMLDGKVLLAGGSSSSVAELYDPLSNTSVATGSMVRARREHAATLLRDGRVLFTGGCHLSSCSVLSSAEIYDAGTFSAAGSMAKLHRRHRSVLLPSGKVLVASGCGAFCNTNEGPIPDVEIYDPSCAGPSCFSQTEPLRQPRKEASLTVLPTGRVVMIGGAGKGASARSAELFEPNDQIDAGTFTAIASMVKPRAAHSATLLNNGQVLLAGGVGCIGPGTFPVCPFETHPRAELYDPFTGMFALTTGSMVVPRGAHTATVLHDGRVLMSGGCASLLDCVDIIGNPTMGLSVAEVYDPGTQTFSATLGDMSVRRVGHAATTLPSGEVLVTGGCDDLFCTATDSKADVDLYDPVSSTWSKMPDMAVKRGQHRSILLESGRVLVIGGRDAGGAVDPVDVFDPELLTFSQLPRPLEPRAGFGAALLPGDLVLLGGGLGAVGVSLTATVSSAEIYDSSSGLSIPTDSMVAARYWVNHDGMVPLLSGKVLAVGPCANLAICGGVQNTREVYDRQADDNRGVFFRHDGGLIDRAAATKTRLPSGDVLITGGCELDLANTLCLDIYSTAERYSEGLIGNDGWRPVIASTPTSATAGGVASITGTGFLPPIESSSGTNPDSATNAPTLLWYPAAGGYPLTGQTINVTDTSLEWIVPLTARHGQGAVHIVVGGVPSASRSLRILPAAAATPCTAGAQCASGWCADGVCCDNECGGQCEGCTAATKGFGVDGVCGPIGEGLDPDDDCTDEGQSSCGTDGVCDGTGFCRMYASGTLCQNAVCAGGQLTPPGSCDGAGSCVTEPPVACAPGACNVAGNACTSSCTSSADCSAGSYCAPGGVCANKEPNGADCFLAAQCQSDHCVDGVCCETSCTGQCEACNLSDSRGVCVAVQGDPPAGRPPCAGFGPPCAGTCDGTTRASCRYPGLGTSCGQSQCTDGVAEGFFCDGAGACGERATVDCFNFACGAMACNDTCESDDDCAAGFECDANDCVTRGTTCDGDHTLTSVSGETTDCSPYRCNSAGTCDTRCESTADCAEGSECDADGNCIAVRAPAADLDPGCACRQPAGRRAASAWWLAGLALAIAGARRRRSSRGPRRVGASPRRPPRRRLR